MTVQLTPSMRRVIEYFEDLGPRWGLDAKGCGVHALLYLTAQRLTAADIATILDLDDVAAKAAIDDLVQWRVVKQSSDGRVWTKGEPWDLLFAGMEERRRREIEPALLEIGEAAKSASNDGTSRPTAVRINSLHDLLQDLSAVGAQIDFLPTSALKGAVRLGGRVSKLFSRR